MVAANTELKKIAGAVCPGCYKQMPFPAVVPSSPDKYGRHIRTYYGKCPECNINYEVSQFEKDGRWHIQKFRRVFTELISGDGVPAKNWTTLQPLPDPAPVVVGPGGDYRKPVPIKQVKYSSRRVISWQRLFMR